MSVSELGLQELTALVAVQGMGCIADAEEHLIAALNLSAEGHTEEAQAILEASGSRSLNCTVHLPSPIPGLPDMHVSVTIPGGYPEVPLCSVLRGAGGGVSRACLDAVNEELASMTSREGHVACLHDMLEVISQRVEAEAARLDSNGAASAAGLQQQRGDEAAGDGGGGAGGEGQLQQLHVVLVRLDHLHNRTLYVKTLSNWAKELCLTGRFIFQGFLILILMEGAEAGVKEYMVRHRTLTVDIDSRGRQCKERMAMLIAEEPHPLGAQRAFKGFRDVDCCSFQEVEALLAQAGMGKHARAAAGLPPT